MYKGGFLRVVKFGIFRTLELSEVDAGRCEASAFFMGWWTVEQLGV